MSQLRQRLIISAALFVLASSTFLKPAPNVRAMTLAAPRITSIALSSPRGDDRVTELLPYIEQDNIVVRSINRRTGLRRGDDLVIPFTDSRARVRPVKLLFSTIFRPGSLLVLDSSLRVHEFPLVISDSGTPFVVGGADGVVVHGPFGDPSLVGDATAMAEAPLAAGTATLAVGTAIGGIIAVLIGLRTPATVLQLSTFPIDDLAVIPQVGHWEFVAVANGHLIGVNPDADARTPGLQPEVTFDLTSPLSGPHIVDIGAQIHDETSNAFTSPTPVRIVAANGTNEVMLFEIPANPSAGRVLFLEDISRFSASIRQVAVGSLVALTADGSGVLYQPGFSLEDGFKGRTVTIAGATMRIDPETLALRSRGRYVTASVEVANGGGGSIDTRSLELQVEGVSGSVPVDESFTQQGGDQDEDDNPKLTAKFDRAAVTRLLRSVAGENAVIHVTWNFTDGTSGVASAEIRLIK